MPRCHSAADPPNPRNGRGTRRHSEAGCAPPSCVDTGRRSIDLRTELPAPSTATGSPHRTLAERTRSTAPPSLRGTALRPTGPRYPATCRPGPLAPAATAPPPRPRSDRATPRVDTVPAPRSPAAPPAAACSGRRPVRCHEASCPPLASSRVPHISHHRRALPAPPDAPPPPTSEASARVALTSRRGTCPGASDLAPPPHRLRAPAGDASAAACPASPRHHPPLPERAMPPRVPAPASPAPPAA